MNLGLLGLPKNLVTDLLLWLVPIGAGFDWWCDESDTPRGYIVPYGQDILQSQYPRLYAKWFKNGTHKYGAGSVSNSTKAPDRRGRSSIGKDDMGGTAANRVTSGGSGIAGNTLGANGGAETVSLSLTQNALHNHSSDAGTVNGVAGTGPTNPYLTSPTANGAATINNSGSGAAHQNMTPGIVCNYIIRAG